jgi:uncharacterized sporulation protein YeaH/YhbH (DUF444 family)
VSDFSAPSRFMRVVDRRGDPPGRSAVNRERFIRRFKDEIKRAVDDEIEKRGIADVGKGSRISIPGRGLKEPHLNHDRSTGSRDFVLPGNREYLPGDTIERPDGGGDGGLGNEPGEGESRDNFSFVLSRDEFLRLFFDDLELPNLERTRLGDVTHVQKRRAGFSRDGVLANLSPARTMLMSIARRIALRGGISRLVNELEREIESLSPFDVVRRAELEEEIAVLRGRREKLPFLEAIDRRFRARQAVPAPATRAVMLCLMDVSGSMDERKKDLAKRFFSLLYLFLERKYSAVDVVFIRHTETAQEVDEKTFFYDPQSGGTLVMPALLLAQKVIDKRFAGPDWNVYIAQASDGDCGEDDAERCVGYMRSELLPRTRYFAYIDIPSSSPGGWFNRPSALWQCYETIADSGFAMRRVHDRRDIWPVFHELFARKEAVA